MNDFGPLDGLVQSLGGVFLIPNEDALDTTHSRQEQQVLGRTSGVECACGNHFRIKTQVHGHVRIKISRTSSQNVRVDEEATPAYMHQEYAEAEAQLLIFRCTSRIKYIAL